MFVLRSCLKLKRTSWAVPLREPFRFSPILSMSWIMAKPWKELELRNGLKVKIDEEDADRINEHTWRVIKKPSGRLKVVTNIQTEKGSRQVSLGQFLMNPPPGKMVYPRRFQQGLDYRKENLVVCTMQERQLYLPKTRKAVSSKYRGVYFLKSKEKWRAAIKVNGKKISIGLYDTEEDAALAYNKAARQHFGDLAYQNRVELPSESDRRLGKQPKSA